MEAQPRHELLLQEEAAGSRPSHALLLPYPAQGHITPFMLLGKRLASQAGVLATVAVADYLYAKLTRAQAAGGDAPNIPGDGARLQLAGIKVPHDLNTEDAISTDDTKDAMDAALAEGAFELMQRLAAQGRPVTCIVGDFFLPWTCSVAERAAVPEYVFWPQNATVFCIYMHVDSILAAGYNPFDANVKAASSRETELITCIPGLPIGIHPTDLPFEGGPFGQNGLNWMRGWLRDRFGCISKAHGVIGNSFQALEAHMFRALSDLFMEGMPRPSCWPRSGLRLVGPLVPGASVGEDDVMPEMRGSSLWAEEVEECTQWLGEQAPGSVLFVAFGSTRTVSVKQAQELAFGLAASGQKFLWVIREIASEKEEEEVSSTGEDGSMALEKALPLGFFEENEHVCKVVRWAPQARVLAHPAVGGFFTHCGWNSTLEALCCGLPVLGWPCLMDQLTNCWLASHVWKVGLTLELDLDNQVSRQQVESGVRQLMEGPLAASMHARAAEIKDLARKASRCNEGLLSFMQEVVNL